jgi:hypothetical protein
MKKTLIVSGLFLAFLVLVAAKYDYILEMGGKTVKSSECKKCHKGIYGEWSQNYHAKAYINEQFKRASKDYRVQVCCLPCCPGDSERRSSQDQTSS